MRLLSCALFLLVAGCAAPEPEAEAPRVNPVDVGTAVATTREVPRTLRVTGTLVAVDDADVSAETAGSVERIHAERGDLVAAGAPLIGIDTTVSALQAREAAAALAGAEAQVRLAESECARAASLTEAGGISIADRDRALTQCEQGTRQLEMTRARKALADTQLARGTVRAPFAGVVAERLVSPGDYVGPGRAVVKLVAIDPLRLDLSVPERAASLVKPGASIEFELTEAEGVKEVASVTRISPALRERTRDLVVEATVPNPDGRLRPNSFAVARLGLGTSPGLVVPVTAVRTSGEFSRVFLVVGDKAEERVVDVGVEVEGVVEIVSGLAEGEVVINPIPEGLADGAPLRTK